ncbi:hypothetical protein R3W88_030338 [Solanum pinnatisectum]|uniref:Uncharacterized protein n=1 Tax=Solanum pinnatisectum TaxID=50273 RepID=A0AAV9K898_9SOLN|nr:hypothetical protein R3W88_030338 [Solanum pinnatisectum]
MGDACKYAVVTGANKGIGYEIVKQLANSDRGMETMYLLNEQGFSNVVFHQLDVQDAQSIESLAMFIQTPYGRLDILVNNAGASGVAPDEDVLRAMNIDLVDWQVNTPNFEYAHLDTSRRGALNMMLPAYSVPKVSLNAYTQILARKYPKICINCVHPGFVNTDITCHTGTMPVEEGAEGPVMLALLPDGGPTGCYFDRTVVSEF